MDGFVITVLRSLVKYMISVRCMLRYKAYITPGRFASSSGFVRLFPFFSRF